MWFKWLLIAIYVVDGIRQITVVNQARDPLTPTDVAVNVCCYGLIIWGLAVYIK